ncbi:ArsR family transcriptional regulator [Noviherbaspirillum cavernae]|uniref:ArsR family transcriptional regulator n=2 Tax=Noviherbaspirillum cavernae TaxID=2320862 RepID=A0A418X6A2_9BURK|nr:ArsR family transcriptional regulator [Noviherbaspirillum cavernae]
MGEIFEEVANYFSLLCEPTRLKILYAVCNGERSVGEIVTEVESTQANVSRQINMLYRARILARRKEGTQVYYRIEDQKTIAMCKTVCSQIATRIAGNQLPVSREAAVDVKANH